MEGETGAARAPDPNESLHRWGESNVTISCHTVVTDILHSHKLCAVTDIQHSVTCQFFQHEFQTNLHDLLLNFLHEMSRICIIDLSPGIHFLWRFWLD